MRTIQLAIELFDPRYELRQIGGLIFGAKCNARRLASLITIAILSLAFYLGILFLTSAVTQHWTGPLLAGQPVQDAAKLVGDSVRDGSFPPIKSLERKARRWDWLVRMFPHRVALVLTALILSLPLAPILNVPCRSVRLGTLRAMP